MGFECATEIQRKEVGVGSDLAFFKSFGRNFLSGTHLPRRNVLVIKCLVWTNESFLGFAGPSAPPPCRQQLRNIIPPSQEEMAMMVAPFRCFARIVLLTFLLKDSSALRARRDEEKQEEQAPPPESWGVIEPSESGGIGGSIFDRDGREYSLTDLQPYTDLFSPDDYALSVDGTKVTYLRTGESFSIPVARAVYDSGTVLQTFSDEGGEIAFAEIHHFSGRSDSFDVRADRSAVGTDGLPVLSFEIRDDDATLLQENYEMGEAVSPSFEKTKNGKKPRKKRKKKKKMTRKGDGADDDAGGNEAEDAFIRRQLLPDFVYRRGDGTSAECTYFKVVNLAVVYDAEFCQRYGSFEAARNRVLAIVASASVYYERDMCVKLQLTDVYTPDNTCRSPSPTFRSFTRSKLCGGDLPHMLYDFSKWIAQKRAQLGLNSKALIHLMTGFQPPGRTLGCAWLGTCKYRNIFVSRS